jgi:acyl-CoA synthetase (AMP-forming)/AMP-acid ligase II
LLDAGLRRDDVVCLQLPTTHEHIVAYLACMRLGLVATPVPFQYREHELEHIITHLSVRAFVTAARIGKHDHAAMALAAASRASGPRP